MIPIFPPAVGLRREDKCRQQSFIDTFVFIAAAQDGNADRFVTY
jgi:hypothetical protein